MLALVSTAAFGALSQPRSAEAIPGDICRMVVWDSTGRVLNNNDTVGGDGKFYALARVEDHGFGFVSDFLEDGPAKELIEEALAEMEARIVEIETRLAEIEAELQGGGLTPEEEADLENEKQVLEDELFDLEEIIREIREALERFGDFNLALVDAQTGSARIRSYAEVGGFSDSLRPQVYHRLIQYPGVGSQKIDHIFPDFFADPDGHTLDSIRAWLAEVAGVPVPSAITDAADVCGTDEVDGWKFVDLACFQAGSFNFSISSHQKNGSSENVNKIIRLFCPGQADTAEIKANPTMLETQPVAGHTDTSIITVTVYDQFGDNLDGAEVKFIASDCKFENPYAGVSGDLGMAPLGGGSVVTVRSDTDSAADGNFLLNHPLQTQAGTAEVALDCVQGAPGVITVKAIVTRPGADIELTQEILLVGPTSAGGLTLMVAPASTECGEQVLATAMAVDVNGVPVSDGTRIYFTTDTSSGIINGVEGGQGSSTTKDGEAKATIAMAPNDPGVHTVIAYTLNSSGAVGAQVAVQIECHAPSLPRRRQ